MDLDSELCRKLAATTLHNVEEEPFVVNKDHFNVNKFLGRGCYSLVFEVEKKIGIDSGTLYALKKFFMLSASAMKCVLRERQILQRLAENKEQSAFLPTLYYSLWIPYSPIFILNEGCGRDLFDLIRHVGQLDEYSARFYLVEIISGLEIVHKMGIIHLDLKPENILFRENGHVFIADFDRSFDSTLSTTPPTEDDFTGTPLFMAPEIAGGKTISKKADVWSLGVLMAEMVSGPIRPGARNTGDDFKMAREGKVKIHRLKQLTKGLQSFFSVTLKIPLNERVDLQGLKKLTFLKSINWENVASLKLIPPFNPLEINHRPSKEDRQIFAENDESILNDAFSAKPSISYGGRKLVISEDGQDCLADLRRETPTSFEGIDLISAFADFHYIHPKIRSESWDKFSLKDSKLLKQNVIATTKSLRSRTLSVGD